MIKYKKLSASLFIGIMALISVTGCSFNNSVNSSSNSQTTITTNSSAVTTSLVSSNSNSTIEFDDEDLDASYNESDCTVINLSGSSVDITSAGTYLISGTLTDGCIRVNYSGKSTVRLIFNGVNITCDSEAPVVIEDGKKVIITLASGSENTITDNRSSDIDDGYSGAISSKADLIINGSGKLNITANHRNGIKSSDDLKIVSGNFNIKSNEDGIVGKECLCIKSGDFTINAGDDGMKSTYDTDDSKGYIIIENGTFDITCGNDGIQSEHRLTIYDGTFNIKTGSGASESIKTSSSMDVNPGSRFGGDFKNNTSTSSSSSSESIKGIKAGGAITLVSGNYTIDSEDDSIHSNDTILISGGTYQLSSGDDAIHADNNIQIDNGSITVNMSYEGIEAAIININGGDISVTSSDDGINASDGSTTEGGGAFFNRGGGKTSSDNSSSSNNISLNISGGKLYVNASGDGLDSNGAINISGGEIIVEGPTSSGDTALDYETSLNFTGGTVMAFGSSGMVESPTSASNGCAIVSVFTSQSANSAFSLTDASGNVIMSANPSKAYAAFIIYSADIKSNTEYTITAGNYTSTVTTSSAITSDGNAGSGFGGFGGQGGMRGGKSDNQQPADSNMQPSDNQMQQPNGNMQQPDGQSNNQMMPNSQSNGQMMPGQSGNQTF